jgi:hypothetical protein
MDIPQRGPRSSVALPDIHVHDSLPTDRYRPSKSSPYSSTSSPSNISGPMSIPKSRDLVPPPLPPPRYMADIAEGGKNGSDIAWHWANSHVREDSNWRGSISSVIPGSSLFGNSVAKNMMDERPDFTRRSSSTSTIKSISGAANRENAYPRIDEGYASLSGTSIGSIRYVYLHVQSVSSQQYSA